MRRLLFLAVFSSALVLAGEPRYKNPTTPNQIYQNDLDVLDVIRANDYGVRSGASAPAGKAGEYISSTTAFNSATTTGQYKDAVSFALTAGDWFVSLNGLCVSEATTNTDFIVGFSTTSGNDGSGLIYGINKTAGSFPSLASIDAPFSISGRLNISASKTIYLKYLSDYTGTAPQLSGALQVWRLYHHP